MSLTSKASHRRNYHSFFEDRHHSNPFVIPDDDQIFSFREKPPKPATRVRIWNKGRPARAGWLRRLWGENIIAAPVAIRANFRNIGLNKTHEFTIPVERPKNKENRWELISKKRQMDFMKEMIKTKRSETNKIESYTAKRNEALNESEKFLAQDIKSFVDFFKNNTQDSKDAINKAELQKKVRIEKANDFKKKSEQYQKMLTNINKNIETLEELYLYKEFIDSVSSKVYKQDHHADEGNESENVHPNVQLKAEPASPLKLQRNVSTDKGSVHQKGKILLEGVFS